MNDISGPQRVSRAELMRIREDSWSGMLRSVSLVAECLPSAEDTEQALHALGGLFWETPGHFRQRILRRWPAVHVMATTTVATTHYDGSFWPALTRIAGIEQSQMVQREWGEAYLSNLEQLELPTFSDSDDAGSKYVGKVLMHSGMPTACLGDFFRTVSERRSAVPGLTAEEFVGWAATARLNNVDVPVVRFLRYGGEFAVDVVDRSFELLDLIAGGASGSDALLPARFQDTALDLHRRGQISAAARRRNSKASADADALPVLALDPHGRGVYLKLPAVSEAPDGRAAWLVTIDSQSTRVETRAMWPGALEPAPPTAVSIASPAREATVALEGWEHLVTRLRLVDDQLPLLAFDTEGNQLAPGLPWRARTAWLLFPEAEQSLVVRGDLDEIHRGVLPPGWAGWSLILADLTAVDALSLETSEREQLVRRSFSASIELDGAVPVPGLRTEGGEPVWPIAPGILLPEEAGPDAEWQVSILDGMGKTLASKSYRGDYIASDIWDELDGHLLGTFTVRVRGPWGRGCSRTFTLAEDLETQLSPPWRRLASGGLVPATVEVTGPDSLEIDGGSVSLGRDQTKAVVRMRSQGAWRSFIVEPPHMSMTYQTTSANLGPTVNPLALYAEDIRDDPGSFIVSVGAGAEPRLHVKSATQHLQILEPGAVARDGMHRFDLSRIVDTLTHHPQVRLSLDVDGLLEVAAIRPRRLASGQELVDGELRFFDAVNVPGLTALVYATRAPWRGGYAVPVSDGWASLPAILHDAGPLRVSLRVDDPWAPEPIPSWPELGTSRLCDADGWVASEDVGETAISQFLAGVESLPEDDLDRSRLWVVQGLLPSLHLQERLKETHSAVGHALRRDPTLSLLALASGNLDPRHQPRALIETGLVCSPLGEGELPRLSWSRHGILASVLLSPDGGEVAETVLGDVYQSLLSGVDPCQEIGTFGRSADMMALMTVEQSRDLRKAAAFVPSGLLSGDSRANAAMQLFDERGAESLDWLKRNAHKFVEHAARLFGPTMSDCPEALAALNARRHPQEPGGWRALPTLSTGLAFAARLAARGDETAAQWVLTHQLRGWADLAAAAPDLVTIDLIVAELTLHAKERV